MAQRPSSNPSPGVLLGHARELHEACRRLKASVEQVKLGEFDEQQYDSLRAHLEEARALRAEVNAHTSALKEGASSADVPAREYKSIKADKARSAVALRDASACYANLAAEANALLESIHQKLSEIGRGRRTLTCYKKATRVPGSRFG